MSSELDSTWLLPLRGGSGVPLLATVRQLRQSDAYRQVAGLLTSDVRDYWDDDEWRLVSHAARYQGRPATASSPYHDGGLSRPPSA